MSCCAIRNGSKRSRLRENWTGCCSPTSISKGLAAFLDGAPPAALSLATFRRKSIFRILLRDVLGFATVAETAEELSNLADGILETAYLWLRGDLAQRYGDPSPAGFAVIAMGKHGGCELNYSSDIDLMFVYAANGETTGANRISNKEFYKKLGTQLTALLSTHTAAGLCYRVDLRLRPEGSGGEVCISLDGARAYYRTRARDWEFRCSSRRALPPAIAIRAASFWSLSSR
jgi:[glutamine synthetase] adenylyltransferase / [glutamine synthetase]-adenylyl-L-tyrosine phosphorylase